MIGEGAGVSVAARTQAPATAQVPHKRNMANHLGDAGASQPRFNNISCKKRRHMELFVYDTDFNEADDEFEEPSFDTSSCMLYSEIQNNTRKKVNGKTLMSSPSFLMGIVASCSLEDIC